jgi:uncharacterized protein YkwD
MTFHRLLLATPLLLLAACGLNDGVAGGPGEADLFEDELKGGKGKGRWTDAGSSQPGEDSGTPTEDAGVPSDLTPPSIPAGLGATASTCGQVDLSWQSSTDTGSGVRGYRLYRGGALLKEVIGTAANDTSVAPGTAYTYQVSAVDHAGNESDLSDSSTVTAPGACAGPTCGDLVCAGNQGETCTKCASDCKTTAEVCGNGQCQGAEDGDSCYADCGPTAWPSAWLAWEEEAVKLINQHRAKGTNCPSGNKSAVGPVGMNAALRRAAQLHSWDQSYAGYFSHTSCNGRSPWQRAAAEGTSASGEVIAWGHSSPSMAVEGWMASTAGHCDALMNGNYKEIGLGYARHGANLWTGMFR